MTPRDSVATLGRSLVQHGPLSNRAYLMRLDPRDMPDIVQELDHLARDKGYGKIFAKIPESLLEPFLEAGFGTEALVPGMFPGNTGTGRENGHFISKFLDRWRSSKERPDNALKALRLAATKVGLERPDGPPEDWVLEQLGPEDAEAMASLYANTFLTYPFPIDDPEYLRETMAEHVVYFGVRLQGELAALSACEADESLGLVEMTDFAANDRIRGTGVAYYLLERMEREMRARAIAMAYSISRAISIPINITFARRGYAFAGTLVRNTNICGALESMNVWYKALNN